MQMVSSPSRYFKLQIVSLLTSVMFSAFASYARSGLGCLRRPSWQSKKHICADERRSKLRVYYSGKFKRFSEES